MPIDLYYLSVSPPCRAVLMTARALNIEVNIKQTDLTKGQHLTPEYLKLNPGHTVPTIVDGKLVLFESRPIMQYLCNKYAPESQLYPKDPIKRANVDRWLNTDLAYFLASKYALVEPIKTGNEPTEQTVQTFKATLKLVDTLIDDNQYLAGDHLTIADLSVLATTTLLSINDYQDFEECPNLKKWFQRLSSDLSYYQQINGRVAQDFKDLVLFFSQTK